MPTVTIKLQPKISLNTRLLTISSTKLSEPSSFGFDDHGYPNCSYASSNVNEIGFGPSLNAMTTDDSFMQSEKTKEELSQQYAKFLIESVFLIAAGVLQKFGQQGDRLRVTVNVNYHFSKPEQFICKIEGLSNAGDLVINSDLFQVHSIETHNANTKLEQSDNKHEINYRYNGIGFVVEQISKVPYHALTLYNKSHIEELFKVRADCRGKLGFNSDEFYVSFERSMNQRYIPMIISQNNITLSDLFQVEAVSNVEKHKQLKTLVKSIVASLDQSHSCYGKTIKGNKKEGCIFIAGLTEVQANDLLAALPKFMTQVDCCFKEKDRETHCILIRAENINYADIKNFQQAPIGNAVALQAISPEGKQSVKVAVPNCV